jgi:stringent starvation protein B
MNQELTSLNEQKRRVLDALLGLCPFVLIDATAPGVSVPEGLKQQDLVLRVGRDPKVMGMPDLVLDAEGFSATISIRGVRHFVTIPWEACSRCWVGEPFVGPVVIWPDSPPRAENEVPKKPAGLRLVKN